MDQLKIDNVCVAVDLSDHSARTVNYGVLIANRFGARLHLLHVLHDLNATVMAAGDLGNALDTLHKEMHSHAQTGLESLELPELEEHVKIIRAIRQGLDHVEISNYCDKHGIDLLIVGSHGRTGLQHLLLGSVAERVMRSAPCPVTIVRCFDQKKKK